MLSHKLLLHLPEENPMKLFFSNILGNVHNQIKLFRTSLLVCSEVPHKA